MPDDLDFVTRVHDALLDAARHHRAATRDREHVLDRHQERLVQRPLRLRNRARPARPSARRCTCSPRRPSGPRPPSTPNPSRSECRRPGTRTLESSSRTSSSTSSSSSSSSTWSTLFMNTTMCGTFTWRASSTCSRVCGIGPSARSNHQDRAVHLRRARDHVLHVVRVAGAVDVRVVAPIRRLVLHVRRRDRDAALALLREPCRCSRSPPSRPDPYAPDEK